MSEPRADQPPLADQPARRRITDAHDETLFVEAGAGSGKTSSLVSRLVGLVLGGVDITSIAAITFSEAAAAELRARVRQTLEQIEAGHPVRHVDDSPASRQRAADALDRLDRSTICTLHAFAQRLLLAAPVEARLPPSLQVHDDISSALRFEDRWQRFERALLDDDALAGVLRAGLALGITSRDLQVIAATLGENWDLVEEADQAGLLDDDRTVDVDLGVLDADHWIRELDELCALADDCVDPHDALRAWLLEQAAPARAALVEARHDPYLLLGVIRREWRSPRKGRKAQWPDGYKDEIVARALGVRTAMDEALATLTDRVLTRLGAEVARHTLDDAEARRREGRLEFHDLLVLARRLLRSRADVRRRFHHRYRHLLIDEFQDTDPIQVELAVRIAADPEHDARRPWDELDVEPGRLFFVGDPKQSIYRFRRADIDLFSRTARRYTTGYTSLHVNFRTVEPVLRFCNAVFERMIRPEHEDLDDGTVRVAQPPYTPLTTHRPALEGDPGPPVVVLGDGTAHDTAADARDAEARDVAAVLRRAHDEGWLVDADTPRPCRWGDLAVLLPSRTTLSQLRSWLDDLDVPYRLESGTLVYGTTEVTDLLSILRAVDDPGDHVAVVGALRSPAYGCGDDDLHRWVRAHGHLGYLGSSVPPDAHRTGTDPVEAGLADLRRRHREAPFQTVPETVGAVIHERRLMELTLAGTRHRDVWRLYRVVLEHARQFADTEVGGLRAFLRWTELQSDDKRRATSPVVPEADVDAVRVLTIHGAKGLEFPVTVVSGLSAEDPRGVRGATVRFRPAGGFDVRMRRGMETARFESVRTLEESMDHHERIRLLYVALTRARDHLVVSSHHTGRGAARSHGGRLSGHLDDLHDELRRGLAVRWSAPDAAPGPAPDAGPAAATVPPDAPAAAADGDDDWWAAADAWRRERRAVLDRAAVGGAVSATALARHLAADPTADPVPDEPPTPQREPWRRGRAGTAVGSAVHAVLQHADLADPAGRDLADLACWQAEVEGVPHAAAAVEHKARAALASPLVRRAVASGTWRREVHVAVPVATVVGADASSPGDADLLEGFIDLLFDDGDGFVVVDYKTDDVATPGAVRRALHRYAPQGAAYAVAVEAATGRPVTGVHFLFLQGDEAVDAPVDDLADRTDRVRSALAGGARPVTTAPWLP